MEIKIDMNGSDVELATFLHDFTINLIARKKKRPLKRQIRRKKGRPKKVVKADPEPDPSDDILDDPEMADIGAHIFGDGD